RRSGPTEAGLGQRRKCASSSSSPTSTDSILKSRPCFKPVYEVEHAETLIGWRRLVHIRGCVPSRDAGLARRARAGWRLAVVCAHGGGRPVLAAGADRPRERRWPSTS